MHVDERLKINLKVVVTKEDKGNFYISSIQDLDGDEIHIAIPYYDRVPMKLKTGDLITVGFAGDNEVYSFQARVLGPKNDLIPLFRLRMIEQIKRIQRRKYVRIPVRMKIKVTEISDEKEITLKEADPGRDSIFSVDLSAGGMKFHCDQCYSPDTGLLVEFPIIKGERQVRITAPGRVVRRQKIFFQGKIKYMHSIEFTGLSPGQQDDIFHYVFVRMREIGRRPVLK